MSDSDAWYVIPCPSSVELTGVSKERGTHGSVYCLWECERCSSVWIGQSIPALVRSINEKAVMNESKRLHASSLYRCLRKEARKESHKNWKVDKFSRAQVEDLNAFITSFPSAVFVSKSPELWKCSTPNSAERTDAGEGPAREQVLPRSPDSVSALPRSPFGPGSSIVLEESACGEAPDAHRSSVERSEDIV